MPFYEVHHTHPLTESQRDQLAEAITHIHSRLFVTPAIFVHVVFTDNDTRPMYMAGRRRRSNMIMANVRTGPGRTKEHYTELCNKIGKAWTDAVVSGYKEGQYQQTDANKLRAVFVLGTILTGWEGGFMIPDAGKDKMWFQENLPEMRKKAKEGDEDFAEMLAEIETRDEFSDLFANGNGA